MQGEGVVVALLDTGVDLNHPNLRKSLWTNEAELFGLPGVDDDENGVIRAPHRLCNDAPTMHRRVSVDVTTRLVNNKIHSRIKSRSNISSPKDAVEAP